MPTSISSLQQLVSIYADPKQCAKMVGLSYVEGELAGFGRKKSGKGFAYIDESGKVIAAKRVKQRLQDLVIPPAWQEVWICPDENAHILVTGVDEQGRKQYMYHPKWRVTRDLLKF
jgi:DNA topoisomerase-1